MPSLELNQVKTTYNKVKKLAQKELDKKNYNKSINYLETAADLAYMFNWIYTDSDLENNARILSDEILGGIKKTFSPKKDRVVFHDAFALDNRGLTQQYLRALISWEVDILFVFDGNNLSNSKNIIEELKSYPRAEFFSVDSNLNKEERIKALYEKITDFKPEKAFLHLCPSSVVAVAVWNSLNEVTRYQINLTDHAFWLGVSCIDYSLEFRGYGCTVSYERRNLAKEQLLIQPYYPILDCQPFIGFPSEIPNDAIKIFTGGSYYKMYGKSNMFFKLLKTLIELNSKVIILLAGNGDDAPILKFIKENKFQNKILLLGSRPDITYVFKNSDIYLSTYPVTGGLMGQYAASVGVPLLSYSSDDILCNFSEGFINWKTTSDFKITHTNLDSFKSEALKLIEDKSYRVATGLDIKKHLITEKEFAIHLKQLVSKNKMEKQFELEKIDYDVFSNLYLEIENKYLNQFNFFIVSRFRFMSVFLFPVNVLNFIFSVSNWKFLFKILKQKLR